MMLKQSTHTNTWQNDFLMDLIKAWVQDDHTHSRKRTMKALQKGDLAVPSDQASFWPYPCTKQTLRVTPSHVVCIGAPHLQAKPMATTISVEPCTNNTSIDTSIHKPEALASPPQTFSQINEESIHQLDKQYRLTKRVKDDEADHSMSSGDEAS